MGALVLLFSFDCLTLAVVFSAYFNAAVILVAFFDCIFAFMFVPFKQLYQSFITYFLILRSIIKNFEKKLLEI